MTTLEQRISELMTIAYKEGSVRENIRLNGNKNYSDFEADADEFALRYKDCIDTLVRLVELEKECELSKGHSQGVIEGSDLLAERLIASGRN